MTANKATPLRNGWLSLLLNNSNIANVGDATGLRGSSTSGNLYGSLHTADPGIGGSQTTSETSYTGYARIALIRDGTLWTVSAGVATSLLDLVFGRNTSGTPTITHFAVGTASSGAGVLLLRGALNSSIIMEIGDRPLILAGSATLTET